MDSIVEFQITKYKNVRTNVRTRIFLKCPEKENAYREIKAKVMTILSSKIGC